MALSKENRVSDARLNWLALKASTSPYDAELCSALRELQTLRSKPVAGVEVKLKPLEWRVLDNGTAWSNLTIVGLAYFVTPDGTWAHRNGAPNKVGTTLEDAKAAAEADYRQRVLSTLSLPAQEPVAMIVRIDGEDEITWLEGGPAIGPGDYLYASPQPEAVVTEEMVEQIAQWMALDHVSVSDWAEYSWAATDDLWKGAWRKKARDLTAALKEA